MRFNDVQREMLCEPLKWALIDIRFLIGQGKAEQAAGLADAIHNLPAGLWKEDFDLKFSDAYLVPYQQKYPKDQIRDYVNMANEAMGPEGLDPAHN